MLDDVMCPHGYNQHESTLHDPTLVGDSWAGMLNEIVEDGNNKM